MIGLSTTPQWLLFSALLNGICANAYWVANLPILTESSKPDQRVLVLAGEQLPAAGRRRARQSDRRSRARTGRASVGCPGGFDRAVALGVLVASLVTFIPAIPLFWLREPRRRQQPDALENPATSTIVEADPDDEPVDPVGRRALVTLFTKLLIPDALYTTGEAAAIALLALYFVQRFSITPGPSASIHRRRTDRRGDVILAPRMVRRWGKLRTATTSQLLTVPIVLVMGFSPVFALAYARRASGEHPARPLRADLRRLRDGAGLLALPRHAERVLQRHLVARLQLRRRADRLASRSCQPLGGVPRRGGLHRRFGHPAAPLLPTFTRRKQTSAVATGRISRLTVLRNQPRHTAICREVGSTIPLPRKERASF